MDLFGATFVKSLNKKSYGLVVTDDHKSRPQLVLWDKGIKREFSVPKTLQQNGIAEKKNKTLIETARTILADLLLPIPFWDKAVNTACYVQNRVLVTKPHNKTPYELLHGRTPSIGFMRPFGCPVTIFNTLDSLGKFDGKNTDGDAAFDKKEPEFDEMKPEFKVNVFPNSSAQSKKHDDKTKREAKRQEVLVTKPHNKTPYELLHGRLPSIGFMRHFGCPVTILNTLDPLGKFQGKVDEGFLVGYSVCSKAFRVFNSRTRIVQETLHVNFMENKPNVAGFLDTEKAGEEGTQTYVLFPVLSDGSTNPKNNNKDALVDGKEHDDDIQKSVSPDIHSSSSGAQTRKQGDKTENKDKGKSPVVTITGFKDLNTEFEEYNNNSSNGVYAASSLTKSMARAVKDQGGISQMFNEDFHTCMFACFLSQEEPKRVHQALKDPSWIEVMQEELLQFKMQKVWILVDLPYGKRAIGTKWVYRNKKNERGIVIRNKARLVTQGHTQEEGIDYEKVFALVAMIEDIRLFLAYASFMGFPVYQMDVKSAFLYGTIEEEVYLCQPPGFENPKNPDKVYKVARHFMDYIKLLELALCQSFEKLMKDKFHMSSMGELTFFLGLQVKQKKDGIFISQDKYVAEILKKFRLSEGKSASTPIDADKSFLKDSDGEDVDVHTYSDSKCFTPQ
nr:putative ribonuclease H-like domain-containing protein [Tanacetum cinerariifolium]